MDSRRAEAFSDGVFAVAITVLVLGLLPVGTVPHKSLAAQLNSAWAIYGAYVVSFLTIGIMWLNHHTLLAQVRTVNRQLLALNLVLLMGVVAVPWPTALVADHLASSSGRDANTATIVYGLIMIGISLAFSAMWLYLPGHAAQLGRPDGIPGQKWTSLRFSAGLLGYVAATAIAVVSPIAALVIYGLIAVYYMFEHLPEPAADVGGPDSQK